MKILFSGGGTLGPVTPLLAIHEVIHRALPQTIFLWVGTEDGPEAPIIEAHGIPFVTIASGKLRRYASAINIADCGRIGVGFLQSLVLLDAEKPDLCISAGGYVSLPLHLAAHFRHIPTWVHAQDARIGLANRLMAKTASVVTVGIEKNFHAFPKEKTIFLGNPVRALVFESTILEARKIFPPRTSLPVVLAMGGGTGSARVNEIVAGALEPLANICEIIHVTGRERSQEDAIRAAQLFPHYHPYPFLTTEMASAYALADVIVSRAGFGTMSEAAALRKPLILIPKAGQQEENADCLEKASAAIVLDEKTASGQELSSAIKELLADESKRRLLGDALHAFLPTAKEEDILKVVSRAVSSKA